MRVLLDTNILIHREAATVVRDDIGPLFNWLDQLKYEKYIHPVSSAEIEKHDDPKVRSSFARKLASYRSLATGTPMAPEVAVISSKMDITENDRNDSILLNELFGGRIDFLITEDRAILNKGELLGIQDRIFTIDSFLEKAVAENPNFIQYEVLSVRSALFGNVNVDDPFFDSFHQEYPGFREWFSRKSQDPAYVCVEGEKIVAFLYLKIEDKREPYSDIAPPFAPKRRLKIGTLKVELNGYKLGERFLKIVFDNAIRQAVDEIYVTIFPGSTERERLISLLQDFGFKLHGIKKNSYGDEQVYVRDMSPSFMRDQPRLTFPYVSRSARSFLVSIYPEYHTSLFPDSILKTESPQDFVDPEPHRNAIRKVYVSRSINRDLRPGDVIVFYRTGGFYKGVVTTLGLVETTHLNINSEDQFIRLCRKRSVFSDTELQEQWRYKKDHPFIVDFLYAYTFPRRPNLASLIQNGVIADVQSAPRGFEEITRGQFETILKLSGSNPRVIVD